MAEVCRAFRNTGRCRYGEDCKFEHTEGELIEPPPRGQCYQFQEGNCEYGDDCRFRHGEDDNRPATTSNRRRGNRGPRGECFNWRDEGECEHGDDCRFLHGEDDPRANQGGGGGGGGGGGRRGGGRDVSGEICNNYLRGRCRQGENCRRLHEGEPAEYTEEKSEEVCNNYMRGRCRRGQNCIYQHPPREPKPVGQCHQWTEGGACEYGDDCRFRHGEDDPRPMPEAGGRRRTNQQCFDFRDNGSCEYGEECRFAHGEIAGSTAPRVPKDVSGEVCNNFLAGKCRRGENCRRIHQQAE